MPAYIEHHRLLGRPVPYKEVYSKLLRAGRQRRKVAALLQKPNYSLEFTTKGDYND